MRLFYTMPKRKSWLALILFLCLPFLAWSQGRIEVRVVSMSVANNVDCDGFLNGDSDFVFEFLATDNTIGLVNNNPAAIGVLGDFNYGFRNGDNGPWTVNAPSGDLRPNDGIFFNQEYICPADVPSLINIDWRGYENDILGFNYSLTGTTFDEDLQTGNQTAGIAVPAVGGVNTQSFTATATDGCGNQSYTLVLEVEHFALPVSYLPDLICSAPLLNLNQTYTYGWCPTVTLEPNEPNASDVTNNGSVWFAFTAPASGEVQITTDLSGTEIGTYMQFYHAADGYGCTTGNNISSGAQIKDKFEYLSHLEFADGVDGLGLDPEAEIEFDACDPVGGVSYQKLHPGEVYYVQLTSDDAGERGWVQVRINDLGGSSPPNVEDIPCTAPQIALGTSPISSGASSTPSITLDFDCAFDGGNDYGETGAAHTNSNPENYHAYDYDHPATNNNTVNESVWTHFTAPNSGRAYVETDYTGSVFSENIAFFGPDPRFSPGVPGDYSCANLTNLDAADGGRNGVLGNAQESAIVYRECMEPGYEYYAMADPVSGLNPFNDQFIAVWAYDPAVDEPLENPPPNDILCLTLADPFYEIPVQLIGQPPLPFQAVAGSNQRACIERLAGEPVSDANPANRADQTVWHYFTVPPSGVVEIRLRAYTNLNRLNYAIYPLLNGTDCYGGLQPATYTTTGAANGGALTPIASGHTDFNGSTISLCCLEPGTTYALQLDGGSPGDQGQYIIEYIEEIEVYAGDSQYETEQGDTIAFNSMDTAYICYGDSIFPSVMLDPLGQTTSVVPGCLHVGFMLHNTFPIPDTIANIGFMYIDSTRDSSAYFVNNTNNSGSMGNPLFNQVYYLSAVADEDVSWGDLTCPSASMENGAPLVFLQPLNILTGYDPNNCTISLTLSGGLPAYDGSSYDYLLVNSFGDTIQGQALANQTVSFPILGADIYDIYINDGVNCTAQSSVNASTCNDPCLSDPIRFLPSPIDSTIYQCQAGGNVATATVLINGGYPAQNGSNYTIVVSGSSVTGQNGSYTVAGSGNTTAISFSFDVADGDLWSLAVSDSSACTDTTSHLFTYDQTNCPDFCVANPVVASSGYNCFPTGSALVEVTLGGGAPSIFGSNYTVSVSGSTVFGQSYSNAQIPGTIGSTSYLSFLVNDGDNWTLTVIDDNGCTDTLSNTYIFNSTNCPISCDSVPLAITPSSYNCNLDGTAEVTIDITGGTPFFDGSDYSLTITGLSTGDNVLNTPVAGNIGASATHSFTVADGDIWQVFVEDIEACQETLIDTFAWNATNCGNICTAAGYTPVLINGGSDSVSYDCDGQGNAILFLELTGGLPAAGGPNNLYTATVTINGQTTSQQTLYSGGFASLGLNLTSGDDWKVVLTDALGCSADSIEATFQAVTAVATSDAGFEILVGEAVTLDGTGSQGNITSYLWTPMTGLNDPTQATTIGFPIETTTYSLEVRDDNDCVDYDSVTVNVGACVAQHSGFTPNNDGVNDLWEIPCLGLLEGDLEVYNRWGQLVYRKQAYDNSWDGTDFRSGANLPDATYYYVLKVNYPSQPNPVLFKGTVTIIR